MAASSWMMRTSNVRSGRFNRGRHYNNKEDDIRFDINGDPHGNITMILTSLCETTSEISDGKRLNYLNAFVKMTLHIEGKFEDVGFTMDEILTCLRITLVHESTQVRSGGLRAIRHVIRNDSDVILLNKLRIPYLVVRSLDLVILKNDVERIEAMKLTRKILLLSPLHFHMSLACSLVSLANSGVEEKDRLLRICLATLCELGIVNTRLFIETGGVAAIARNLLECQTPKISESLCGVLLFLLDKPETRSEAKVDLLAIAAPYCDFHYYRQCWKDKDKYVDERELRFNCSRLALLSIFRSWPGILHFCSPTNSAGLKAIVDVLYLNQLEVRKAILDLLYEMLGLPQPEWTDELSVALAAVDPSEPQSHWRLSEGFVAAEGRSILPHLAKNTPSITDMHLSLLLYCFVQCGLLNAISEVIATGDTFISVRATVLLGELLHLVQVMLPPKCCDISPPLPRLVEYASMGRHQAVKAMNGLQELQKLLRARPASYSLYLDAVLRSGVNVEFSSTTGQRGVRMRARQQGLKSKLQQLVTKSGDDVIRESGVLLNKDAYTWNWNLIRIVLKGEAEFLLDPSDTTQLKFLRRLVDFYTPSCNRYSHMDLTSTKVSLAYTTTGVELVNCLLSLAQRQPLMSEQQLQQDSCLVAKKLLVELFSDVCAQIGAITSGKSVHDCLFSPQHMNSTQCQSYFFFIGRMATSELGTTILNDMQMFTKLEHLATTTNNDCYVKLIVSSMDYTNPSGPGRHLLNAILTKCQIESSRLYATQFVLVLMRSGIRNFPEFCINLLVNVIGNDTSRQITTVALNLLHESCQVTEYFEILVALDPDLSHLGERGELLSVRLLSSPAYCASKARLIGDVIKRWDNYMNCRYVKLVESEISDALTLHQRDEDGKYDKRTSNVRPLINASNKKDVFLPPHVYGQLARHSQGLELLIQHGSLDKMLQDLMTGHCDTDDDILRLKASIWAVGHFVSTIDGLKYMNDVVNNVNNGLVAIVTLAQQCQVFSIRAVAYYSLGLVAITPTGADELLKLGWFTTRHNRHVAWPIIEKNEEEKEYDFYKNYDYDVNKFFYCGDSADSDSNIKDIELDEDDMDEFFTFPDHCDSRYNRGQLHQQKSLTLPPQSQFSASARHQRSLSESKTFEMVKSQQQGFAKTQRLLSADSEEEGRRVRHNSTATESTTSNESQPRYHHRRYTTSSNTNSTTNQVLSPIPSSCSLSINSGGVHKVRRYSESSRTRRISLQSGSNNSDRSSHSQRSLIVGSAPQSSSSTGKLSYQDLQGYATLRSLRKSPRYLFTEPEYEVDDLQANISWDVPQSALEDFMNLNNGFPSFSATIKRFSIGGDTKNSPTQKTDAYMGITLPGELVNLFPPHQPLVSSHLDMDELENMVLEDYYQDFNDRKNYTFTHDLTKCIKCCCYCTRPSAKLSSPDLDEDDEDKSHILFLINRFSNPIWAKQVKQGLLQCKQRTPDVFSDLCLYSEVCELICQSCYRLPVRRMIHELFFEFDYGDLYKDTRGKCAAHLAICHNDRGDVKNVIVGQANATSSICSLESLKLAYKENKFPIKRKSNNLNESGEVS